MSPAEEPVGVAVGLCDGLGERHGSLDLEAACRSLESLPCVHAEVVPDLCRSPELAAELAARAGAGRLVLGLCAEAASSHEFQRWAGRRGLDPFALELVRFPPAASAPRDTGRVTLLLAAAVARARAFSGSEPEQLRPRLLMQQQMFSRRSLLTLPPFAYEAVPSVDRRSCLGARRCGMCLPACPAEAIRAQEGQVVVDKERCEACGLCVTACPAGAIGLPGSSLSQYEAEITTLLEAEHPALLFSCRNAAATSGGAPGGDARSLPGWLPVGVPCLGMVTPGWILQALAGGARAVGLFSCGESCRSCTESVLEGRVDYVQALLRLLGDESASQRVRIMSAAREEPPDATAGLAPVWGSHVAVGAHRVVLSEPAATAGGALALRERVGGVVGLSLAHHSSPLGLARFREETCTSCATCAGVCPTGAMAFEQDGTELVLSYDATRCVGCRRCALACPEAADETLCVEPVTDLASLARGRVTLKREALARCRACGRPIAPTRMLERVGELLRGEAGAEPLLRIIGELCADCRGAGPVPDQPIDHGPSRR